MQRSLTQEEFFLKKIGLNKKPSEQINFTLSVTLRGHVKCAVDRLTILCLFVAGFQRQVYKHDKNLTEQSKKINEQQKNKGSVLVAESAYNSQNAQFGLVMESWNNYITNAIDFNSEYFMCEIIQC